jgi:phosphorylcholine metabolism protein LicD
MVEFVSTPNQSALHGQFWKTCFNFSILNDSHATAAKFENSIKEKLRNETWFKTNQNFPLYMEVKQVSNWMYMLERVLCNEINLTFGTRSYFKQNKCQDCHQNMQFLHKEGEESLIWWLPISGLRKNSLNLRDTYLSEIYTWNLWFQISAQQVALMTKVFVVY